MSGAGPSIFGDIRAMIYPKEFFEISLCFAWKIAEIVREPVEKALLHYTNLYIRFGLGRDFEAANPVWQSYVSGLSRTPDSGEWTYQFYLRRQCLAAVSHPSDASLFGCFSYAVLDGGRIRLHFRNGDSSGHGPLSKSRMDERLAELTGMFTHIRETLHGPVGVLGASWLYNIEAYRRLFPPDYLATAQAGRRDFPYLPLWGQFVDHTGRIKEDLAHRFLNRLGSQQTLEDIEKCFPFRALHLESSIHAFYEFYKV